jgi:hypothetical protein
MNLRILRHALAFPAFVAVLAFVLPASGAAAQQNGGVHIDGPPPPIAPAVISRDERGGATIRAVRLAERPRIDGRLDEEWYRTVEPITGFIQSLPDEGALATEETEVWIGFDDANIYVSARVWDSAPESQWVANELRRDTNQLRQNDTFGVVFDTFYDRRNGVMFYTNPLGAVADFALTNEGNPNSDWNPIWDVRTGRFDGGWTVEMEIPFKSLRYRPGPDQVWGIQLRRVIRHKNEWAHLTLVPRSAAGTGAQGVFRVSVAGTLVGLEAPPASRNLEVKPYAISGLRTNRMVTPALDNDLYADVGLDLKYGITENLTADFTYNTDFAQVEVDEAQVNLTRFNLQFPEKREFFLEGRGIFDFAPSGSGAGGPRGGGGNVPTLFFSRRIGLHAGEPVPILGGARLTGKAGAFDVGALTVQTDGVDRLGLPSTNYTVLRLRRDVLRRSSIGALYAGRSRATLGDGWNQTYGVDASMSFFSDVNLVTYYARTQTPGMQDRDDSYRGRFSYDADRYGLAAEHLLVGENFNPEVGFLRRAGFRQSQASARFSPRPASMPSVRKLTYQVGTDYLTSAATRSVEARENRGEFQVELENSDSFTFTYADSYENLVRPFRIAQNVTIPVGRYAYRDAQVGYSFGLQRRYSGNLSLQYGSFFGGDRTSIGFSRARVQILPQFSLEPSLSFNWVDLPGGEFTAHLAATRLNYSFSPRMFLSGLVQYSTATETVSSNFRLRWEYAPGSELFVVYTDDRNVDVFDRFPELSNRGLVIKVNRLFRP